MPCYDDRERIELDTLRKNYAFLEAALCASLKALEKTLTSEPRYALDVIDYEAAGILKEDLQNWQRAHNQKDAGRN